MFRGQLRREQMSTKVISAGTGVPGGNVLRSIESLS